ncbi:MAG: (2Fe-2S)-binding protein [Burkholderiales bacterium]|nr:(2Fe-2S)-binding protein [Burkholderiales bacterium]MCC7116051.1 (2Fe-2S)-binding protein [Burkholderiales bacterium]
MVQEKQVTLSVNGRSRTGRFPAHRTLLEALRELGHTEVKCGCEKGDCGACAVLVDGKAVDSCLTLVWTAEGRAITTVVGLGNAQSPHPLQKAFAESGAAQCGYCIPGMVIAAKSLLDRNPDPGEEDVRIALSGNLCRCTGYTKIFEAVSTAAAALREEGGVR